jgi:hypothetical protein
MRKVLAWVPYISLAALGGLHLWIASLSSPFPYSDDWQFVFIQDTGDPEKILGWIFELHVDHFIPLQKALQLGLLSLFEFDCRVLAIFNALMAIAATWFFIRIGRDSNHSGQRSILLSLFPIVVLLPSSNYLSWGFQFNFVASLLLIGVAGYLLLKIINGKGLFYLFAFALVLFLNVLLGGHGVIISVVFGITMTVFVIKGNLPKRVKLWFSSIFVLFILLPSAYIISLWKPSEVSSRPINIENAFEGFLNLIAGSLNVFLFTSGGQSHKLALFIILLVVVVIWSTLYSPRNYWNYSLWVSVLLAAVATLLVISISRSSLYETFQNHLIIHYQALSALVGVSLIGLLLSIPSRVGKYLNFAFGVLVVVSWSVNLLWKMDVLPGQMARIQEASISISEGRSFSEVVNLTPTLFWWTEEELGIQKSIEGLEILYRLRDRD